MTDRSCRSRRRLPPRECLQVGMHRPEDVPLTQLEGIALIISPPYEPRLYRVAGCGGDGHELGRLPLLHLSVPPLRSQGVRNQNHRKLVEQLLNGNAEQPGRGFDFRPSTTPPRISVELQPSTDVELRTVGVEEFMHVGRRRPAREPPPAHEAKGCRIPHILLHADDDLHRHRYQYACG